MKSLFFAAAIFLMTVCTASAHGRFVFGVNVGLPYYYPYSYPAYRYAVPPVYYPVPPVYVYPERRVYYRPYGFGRVVERYYVNGLLVERRVKVYGRHGYYPGPYYGFDD